MKELSAKVLGQKALRICFVMFGAYPLFSSDGNETFGGAEVELYHLATYLAGFDHIQVDFIVGDYGQKEIETYQRIRFIKVQYMHLGRYTAWKYKPLRYFHLFRVLLRQNSQIYITKTASELLGWLVLFQKFLKRKKVVFRLASDKDTDLEFWKKNRKLYYLYKLGLKYCDLIYAQSGEQKELLHTRYGIESRAFKNVFQIRKQEMEPKQYILWVSRCEPLKRPLLFIDIVRALPEEKFIMIMPTVRKTDKLLNERIARITTEVKKAVKELKNLEYLEYVPFNQIQQYYNKAKLFVNTSEYEGFPNSFIQSCLGKTGILSLWVNPDGFLTEYDLGYCCRDNVREAIAFIRALDAEKIREMGDHAWKYVKQNHDVSTIGNIYIDDFFALIN